MLVLSRKVGQSIFIGDDITVCVVSLRNGGVRIGVEAPKDITVLREELHDATLTNPHGGPAAQEGSRDAAAGLGRR